MTGGLVPYTEVEVNLQVEDMIKITIEVENKNTVDDVIHSCMLQLSIKDSLKIFGQEEEEAAQKEIQQVHDMSTFNPLPAKDISTEGRKLALSSLISLKQKRNGDIKGISCADRRPQSYTIKKQDNSLLTVATECVFITSTIDVFEGQKMATIDVPSDFLHTLVDSKDPNIHM